MKNKIVIVGFVLLSEFVGIAGSFFTMDSIPSWYATLNRPGIAPPNWVFGPVWTMLYAMIGIAGYILWKRGLGKKEIAFAFKVYLLQLFLNGIWTPIFFGLHNLTLALAVIVLLWFSIGYLIYLLLKISKLAAWLLVPYFLWVSFATILTYNFYILN
jgi:tryptophan-rich sensory protein